MSKSAKGIDVLKILFIISICICSYFSYIRVFNFFKISPFWFWLYIGIFSISPVLLVPILNFKNERVINISKLLYLIVFLVGGILNGFIESTISFTAIYIISFVAFGYLTRNSWWYDKFFKAVSICALLYVIASLIQFVAPAFVDQINKYILPDDMYKINHSLIERGWNIGIAIQASLQVQYITPLIAISFAGFCLEENKKKRIIWLFVLGLSLVSLVICNKRTPIIAIFVCFIFCYFLQIKKLRISRKLLVVLIIGIVFAIIFASSPIGRMLIERIKDSSLQEDERGYLWGIALLLWKENFIFGAGTGAFSKYSNLSVHNSYLQSLALNGIIGFICMTLFIVIPFVHSVKLFRRIERNKFPIKYSIYLLASIFFQLFCLLHCFTESIMFNEVMFLVFQLMGAVSYSLERYVFLYDNVKANNSNAEIQKDEIYK